MSDSEKTEIIPNQSANGDNEAGAGDETLLVPPQEQSKQFLGKYEIIATAGQGAMGVVYKALDPTLERLVAIKTIKKELLDQATQSEILERFKREATTAGKLPHPGIISVYEYSEEAEQAYIAMEYVEGEELADMLARGEKLKLEPITDFMTQMLSALDFAHKNGVVHRDIKPANLIITKDGTLKIADFGIARVDTSSLTISGSVLGTPSFMSPEQCQGQPIDARSDLFSAASVLYYVLTGEKPFPGENSIAIMQRVVNQEHDAPSTLNNTLPKRYDALLDKALAKRPDERFQTGQEFIEALQLVASGKRLSSKKTDKKSNLTLMVGSMLTVAAIASGYLWWQQQDSQPQAEPLASVETQTTTSEPSIVAAKPEPIAVVPPTLTPAITEITNEVEPVAAQVVKTIEETELAPVAAEIKAVEVAIKEPAVEKTVAPSNIGLSINSNHGLNPQLIVGDTLKLNISTQTDAYLYCFLQDASGNVLRIRPNRFSPEPTIKANSTVNIPSVNDQFDIVMEVSNSTENILCAASATPQNDKVAALNSEDLSPLNQSILQIEEAFKNTDDNSTETQQLRITVK